MLLFEKSYKAVERFNIAKSFQFYMKRNKNLYEELNRENLSEGKLRTGNNLSPDYSSAYLRRKKKISTYKLSGTPDLRLSGSFYANLKANVTGSKIENKSDVPHSKYLEKRYGKEIYGIQKDQEEELFNEIALQVVDDMERKFIESL